MTNEEICTNNPHNSLTHFDGNYYWQFTNENGWCRYCNPIAQTVVSEPSSGMRSLSDIRRIVELEKFTLGLATESHELQQNLEVAERERDESDDDLKYTQKQLSEIETKFESILLLFCDADGNPFFEPFDAGNLFLWLNKFAIEQQIKALEQFSEWLPTDYESIEFQSGVNQARHHAKSKATTLRQQLNGGE